MSAVSGPFTITPAAPVQIPQPSYGSNAFSRLVIDNLSGFLLMVQIGGVVAFLGPQTEDAYDVTGTNGAPASVSAVSTAGGPVTGQIAATWYTPADDPNKSWPAALPAAALAIGAAVTYTGPTAGAIGAGVAGAVGGSPAGIPTLATSEMLATAFSPTTTGNVSTTTADLTGFESFIISEYNHNLLPTDIVQIEVSIYAGPGGAAGGSQLIYRDDVLVSAQYGLVSMPIQYPALGLSVDITLRAVTVTFGDFLELFVIGSSAIADAVANLSQSEIQQATIPSQAWTANQIVVLPGDWPVAGWCELSVFISGWNAAVGYLQALAVDNSSSMIIASTAATDIVALGATRMVVSKTVIMPRNPFYLRWVSLAASASNYSVAVELTALA